MPRAKLPDLGLSERLTQWQQQEAVKATQPSDRTRATTMKCYAYACNPSPHTTRKDSYTPSLYSILRSPKDHRVLVDALVRARRRRLGIPLHKVRNIPLYHPDGRTIASKLDRSMDLLVNTFLKDATNLHKSLKEAIEGISLGERIKRLRCLYNVAKSEEYYTGA
ncbi:hypothetical protein GUJ93_ZPchr0005g14586 [Zizania palustris]|uniref:Uncharacterized protein n=1 Tax=Zizania palustris TaxID=103762 RepID=A0A8J5SNT8_ZIZPA|nr:hypothetical protein GUJ93_ZPchr0005g14586 [Zizania palustris]